jgi:hypothetical protein
MSGQSVIPLTNFVWNRIQDTVRAELMPKPWKKLSNEQILNKMKGFKNLNMGVNQVPGVLVIHPEVAKLLEEKGLVEKICNLGYIIYSSNGTTKEQSILVGSFPLSMTIP